MEATFPARGRGKCGGGRLDGLADGLEREGIGIGRRWGDGVREAGLEERVGGGEGGRLGDTRSDEEEDLR